MLPVRRAVLRLTGRLLGVGVRRVRVGVRLRVGARVRVGVRVRGG